MNSNEAFNNIPELLEKYRRGNCTPEEMASVENWYQQLEKGEAGYLDKHPDFEAAALQQLRSRLPELQTVHPANQQTKQIRTLFIRRTAAAAIMGAILFTVFYFSNHNPKTPAVAHIITTGNVIRKMVLPDGSTVWLNRFSALQWKTTDNKRLVQLEGEARFDVVPDAARPFVVRAGETETNVLGTVFNIEAYPGEQEIKTVLLSGRIQFYAAASGKQPAILEPGTMARYTRNNKELGLTSVDNEADAWINGAITFNEVPLQDAITRIARMQQWEVKWQRKETGHQTTSAVFQRETPAQMLEALSFSHSFHFRIHQHTLTIY